MITKAMLESGLEWVYRKTRVEVLFNGNYLDVFVFPDFPKETRSIHLMINIAEDRARIDDLVGNGHGTEHCDSGYGTVAMNVAIQALYAIYGVRPGSSESQSILVTGKVSSMGDPGGTEGIECRDRRNHFWASFGLSLADMSSADTSMKAPLSDLHLKIGGTTGNGTPKTVELEEFWPIGTRPGVLPSDLVLLRSEDVETICAHKCISEDVVNNAFQRFKRSQTIMSSITGLLGLATAGIVGVLPAIGIALTGVWVVNLTASRWSPAFKRWMMLDAEKRKSIGHLKAHIEQLEGNHNGFLWRVFAKFNCGELSAERYLDLAKASKDQYFSFISSRYEDYKYCLIHVRESLDA